MTITAYEKRQNFAAVRKLRSTVFNLIMCAHVAALFLMRMRAWLVFTNLQFWQGQRLFGHFELQQDL